MRQGNKAAERQEALPLSGMDTAAGKNRKQEEEL